MQSKIKSFEFTFSDTEIQDLKARLKNTRLSSVDLGPMLDGWAYGVNQKWLKAMVDKWERMDLKALEERLKRWPHFVTEIEKLNIHFLHIRSQRSAAVPLLLVHGWPGSFYEFQYVIDELVNPRSPDDQAFHVVVPSLPGHGFSQAQRKRGWTMEDNARVLNALMLLLRYDRYMCQGGDWGHQVCRYLGSLHTGNCKLVHLNMCPAPPPATFRRFLSSWTPSWLRNTVLPYLYTEVERNLCQRSVDFGKTGLGYAQVQGTKPTTVGFGLLDSPVGHLAWLGDKWMEWTDRESPSKFFFDETKGDLFLSEQILANVSIYWFTGTILSSFLSYFENRDSRYYDYKITNLTMVLEPRYYISVPFGLSSFKFELAGSTRRMVAKSGNLTFYKEHEQGGHFAALDRPEELVSDMRDFFKAAPKQDWLSATPNALDGK